ncbi:MAG: ester cyclase [Anaerolineaceae bacterium]|nr:MAG: ester cyclase [Anaerolineaceae bacterium]
MSNNLDLYHAFYEESWANPPSSIMEANEKYLSSDFQTLDMDGNVQMDRVAYLGMSQLLFSAFEDFKSVISDARQEGDNVILTSHFEGTHTGDLDLSALELGVIPASGKRIVWPEATTKWTFEGSQIASIQAMDDAGGVGPFLAALGVTPPSE